MGNTTGSETSTQSESTTTTAGMDTKTTTTTTTKISTSSGINDKKTTKVMSGGSGKADKKDTNSKPTTTTKNVKTVTTSADGKGSTTTKTTTETNKDGKTKTETDTEKKKSGIMGHNSQLKAIDKLMDSLLKDGEFEKKTEVKRDGNRLQETVTTVTKTQNGVETKSTTTVKPAPTKTPIQPSETRKPKTDPKETSSTTQSSKEAKDAKPGSGKIESAKTSNTPQSPKTDVSGVKPKESKTSTASSKDDILSLSKKPSAQEDRKENVETETIVDEDGNSITTITRVTTVTRTVSSSEDPKKDSSTSVTKEETKLGVPSKSKQIEDTSKADVKKSPSSTKETSFKTDTKKALEEKSASKEDKDKKTSTKVETQKSGKQDDTDKSKNKTETVKKETKDMKKETKDMKGSSVGKDVNKKDAKVATKEESKGFVVPEFVSSLFGFSSKDSDDKKEKIDSKDAKKPDAAKDGKSKVETKTSSTSGTTVKTTTTSTTSGPKTTTKVTKSPLTDFDFDDFDPFKKESTPQQSKDGKPEMKKPDAKDVSAKDGKSQTETKITKTVSVEPKTVTNSKVPVSTSSSTTVKTTTATTSGPKTTTVTKTSHLDFDDFDPIKKEGSTPQQNKDGNPKPEVKDMKKPDSKNVTQDGKSQIETKTTKTMEPKTVTNSKVPVSTSSSSTAVKTTTTTTSGPKTTTKVTTKMTSNVADLDLNDFDPFKKEIGAPQQAKIDEKPKKDVKDMKSDAKDASAKDGKPQVDTKTSSTVKTTTTTSVDKDVSKKKDDTKDPKGKENERKDSKEESKGSLMPDFITSWFSSSKDSEKEKTDSKDAKKPETKEIAKDVKSSDKKDEKKPADKKDEKKPADKKDEKKPADKKDEKKPEPKDISAKDGKSQNVTKTTKTVTVEPKTVTTSKVPVSTSSSSTTVKTTTTSGPKTSTKVTTKTTSNVKDLDLDPLKKGSDAPPRVDAPPPVNLNTHPVLSPTLGKSDDDIFWFDDVETTPGTTVTTKTVTQSSSSETSKPSTSGPVTTKTVTRTTSSDKTSQNASPKETPVTKTYKSVAKEPKSPTTTTTVSPTTSSKTNQNASYKDLPTTTKTVTHTSEKTSYNTSLSDSPGRKVYRAVNDPKPSTVNSGRGYRDFYTGPYFDHKVSGTVSKGRQGSSSGNTADAKSKTSSNVIDYPRSGPIKPTWVYRKPSESSDINEGGPSGGSPRIDSPVSPPSPAGSSQPETSTPLSQASPGGTSLPPLSPGSSTGGRLEDTLADFQPPKRYVKPEEKQTSRGPGVIIMKEHRDETPQANIADLLGEAQFQNDALNNWSPNEGSAECFKKSVENSSTPIENAIVDDSSWISQEDRAEPVVVIQERVKRKESVKKTVENFKKSSENISRSTENVNKVASRWTFQGASNDMVCKLCQKRVYEMEKIIADKAVYHKTCFKCTHCKRVLSLKNFASIEGELYCKPHFIEIFKTKGNYDEGFGRARAKAKESASETNLQSSSVQKVQAEEVNSTPQQQREILRADDKLEDGRDSIPNIKSLRSRFESSDGDSRKSDWRSSTNGDRAPALSSNARTPSRWDKPKGETPAPINRRPEEDSDGGEVHEEELPAPSHTKNMLAKFKAFEGDQTTPVKKTTSLPSRQARPSPDSGIYETDSYTNGHSRPDDDDSPRNRAGEVVTEELPESGFTRNLVAQWRNKEQESGLKTPSPTVATSKSPARSFSNRSVASSQRTMTPDRDVVVSASEVEDVDGSPGSREVVREADRDDESELPPPSFTRNMLAKFQSMQDEAQREATTVKPVSKKAGSGSQVY